MLGSQIPSAAERAACLASVSRDAQLAVHTTFS